MKVVDVEIIPVAFPEAPLRNCEGVHEPYAVRSIIKICLDSGVIGYGEAYGGEQFVAMLERAKNVVLGRSPYNLEEFRILIGNPQVFAGYEVACLDAIGREIGEPVYQLLGGKVRDSVEYSAYLFFHLAGEKVPEVMSPDAMLIEAQEFVEKYGFKTLKLKGGVLPPDQEVETIRLLRRHFGPGHRLRIDPNAVWSVETSVWVAKELEECDLEYLEDPTEGIAGMARVARKVHVPLATNMCVTEFGHIPPAIEMEAVDVILCDHHFWGGLFASKYLGRICSAFRLGLSMHSNSHLDISMAAMTHLACSIPNLIMASDTHYPWANASILKTGKLKFENGFMKVPEGPGLGIEVDEGKLQELAELYRRNRRPGRDDVSEMRKKTPGWLPMKPRW